MYLSIYYNSFALFYGISTTVGNLMPNPIHAYEVNTISFQTFFVWAFKIVVDS